MTKKTQNRREFLKAGATGLAAITLMRNAKAEIPLFADADPYPELVEVTIPELQAKMKSGALTSRRLVEMYLERIKQVDTKTRSVLELNPDALAIADQMDKERKKHQTSFTGKIEGINQSKALLLVKVAIYGRTKPIRLNFADVEVMSAS